MGEKKYGRLKISHKDRKDAEMLFHYLYKYQYIASRFLQDES